MTLKSYSDMRRINPQYGHVQRADGSPDDNDRVEIGPTELAFEEWHAAGIQPPDLVAMRHYRLQRLMRQLALSEYAGVLLFDPLNIRYATDSTNMQLWNTHNPFRAALVLADGYMVLWDYKNSPFLSAHNPLVDEVRSGASMFYFGAGDKMDETAQSLAAEVHELLRDHAPNNKRLAIDKITIPGYRAFDQHGFKIEEGEMLMEKTRAVKGPDEILAMRCATYACEQAMHEMLAVAKPGLSENEIWAELHKGNIIRGGEWIETRLLSSGPRTNPWFQECGPRIVQNNEILALDTDLIGCYGMCCDISRTWFIGDGEPSAAMREDYQIAYDHIQQNMQLMAPGVSHKDLTFKGHQLGKEYEKLKYSCRFHGVGLCDEWPSIAYPSDYLEGAFEGVLEPGNVLCVEALVSHEQRNFSIKLEEQVLVTENGFECLSQFPHDPKLLIQ